MQKIKKIYKVDSGKNASRSDRQDGQENRTDFTGPFPQRWGFNHVIRKFKNKIFWNYLAWFWVIWKESIHGKGIQSTLFSVQRVQKQWFLTNLSKITFVLFECHRSIDKSINFHFFLLSWKSSWKERVQSCWFKTLSWIPIQDMLSQTLNSNFDLNMFPAKIYSKITKTTYFGFVFLQREFFLKTLAKYNCSGPPAFWCQRYRVDWPSN